MDSAAFDDLLVAILDAPAKKVLDNLLSQLAAAGNPVPEKLTESLNILWEKWSEEELDVAQGEFCIGVAALPLQNPSPLLRKLLPAAIRTVLPPYLARNPIMKTLGVRDENVTLADFSARLHKLMSIKSGTVVFLPAAGNWGVLGAVDNIKASISVSPYNMLGNFAAIPLEVILRDAVIFTAGPDLLKLTATTRPVSAADFRAIVAKRALSQPTDEVLQKMAQAGCARLMRDPAQFQQYWNARTASAAPAGRKSSQGRSLKEMDSLLNAEKATPFTDEDAALFKAFFSHLKAEVAEREVKLLGSCVAQIAGRCTVEQMKLLCEPLLGKAPFWPADPQAGDLEELSAWGELPSKSLEKLASVTAKLFPEDYLAKLAMRLPLKSLNSVLAPVGDEQIFDTFLEVKYCSADLLLWCWKNRKKRPNDELLSIVNIENVCHALNTENLPKAWGPAMRELRELFIDDEGFQKQLIDAANHDAMMFSATLQGALFLNSGERQSLMVKLARVSPELRQYLEHGAGQRILKAGIGVTDDKTPVNDEPNYTSISSHQRLIKELDNLINVLVPENREALKVARAHGDFRENSEFDAAKERRNFLSRRRSELERELARIQPLSMASVKIEDCAVIGSEIELEYDNGEKETYELLGAWDGNPDRKFLAYSTRLGKAVLNQKKGTTFEIPGGRKCTLKAVRQLSAELIAELDQK